MDIVDGHDSLTRKTAHGVTWLAVSDITGTIFRTAAAIILVRLLSPDDFGLVAIATIFTEAVVLTGDLGFAEAIIQRKEVTASHLSATFWAGLALGVASWAVVAAISPLAASFFKNGLVAPVLAVSALVFVIAPLRIVHGTLLRKQLEFFKLSMSEMGQGISYLVVSLLMAFTGHGVWSLVIGNLASHITLVILRWVFCRWRPSFTFSIHSLKDLWGFGINITGTRFVQFTGQKLDYLITGRFLSVTAVGFYNLGYKVLNPITTGAWNIVGRVTFPTFSVIQDDEERLRRGFLKGLSYLSLIVLPLFTGISLATPELIIVVFGSKWEMSILPTRILCVMGATTCISVMCSPIFRSKGRPDIELKLELARVAILVPSLILGAKFGTTGIAVAVSATAVVVRSAQQLLVNRLIHLKTREYLYALLPASFGSAVMALGLLGFRYVAVTLFILPDVGVLTGSVLLGIVIYFVTLRVIKAKALNDMIKLTLETVAPYARAATAKIISVWRSVGVHER